MVEDALLINFHLYSGLLADFSDRDLAHTNDLVQATQKPLEMEAYGDSFYYEHSMASALMPWAPNAILTLVFTAGEALDDKQRAQTLMWRWLRQLKWVDRLRQNQAGRVINAHFINVYRSVMVWDLVEIKCCMYCLIVFVHWVLQNFVHKWVVEPWKNFYETGSLVFLHTAFGWLTTASMAQWLIYRTKASRCWRKHLGCSKAIVQDNPWTIDNQ